MTDSSARPAGPRWRLILNGKAAGDALLRSAVASMRAEGVELGVRVTWEPGDAERYVAEALDDRVDTVVAAGGDGTLSAVATGLARSDLSAEALPGLGLVPLGTANDFATAAAIPADVASALALVRAVPAVPVDLLRIQDGGRAHWCANLASGGFGTRVTVDTDEGLKKMLGGLAYLVTGIARLGRIEPITARIEGPEFAWEGGFIALGLGNARQAGGGQGLCPDAVIDDGRLDLTIVPELSGEVAATVGTLLTEGKQGALERVAVTRQLPWLRIRASQPLVLNLDGEPVESDHFQVECVARRVRMHLPVGCPLLRPPGDPLAPGEPAVAPSPSPLPA